MKLLVAVLALVALSGCASYNTHLRTGCVLECAKWENVTATASTGASAYTPHSGIRSTQVFTPQGGYMVIQSGSTISVIQTSKSR